MGVTCPPCNLPMGSMYRIASRSTGETVKLMSSPEHSEGPAQRDRLDGAPALPAVGRGVGAAIGVGATVGVGVAAGVGLGTWVRVAVGGIVGVGTGIGVDALVGRFVLVGLGSKVGDGVETALGARAGVATAVGDAAAAMGRETVGVGNGEGGATTAGVRPKVGGDVCVGAGAIAAVDAGVEDAAGETMAGVVKPPSQATSNRMDERAMILGAIGLMRMRKVYQCDTLKPSHRRLAPLPGCVFAIIMREIATGRGPQIY